MLLGSAIPAFAAKQNLCTPSEQRRAYQIYMSVNSSIVHLFTANSKNICGILKTALPRHRRMVDFALRHPECVTSRGALNRLQSQLRGQERWYRGHCK